MRKGKEGREGGKEGGRQGGRRIRTEREKCEREYNNCVIYMHQF